MNEIISARLGMHELTDNASHMRCMRLGMYLISYQGVAEALFMLTSFLQHMTRQQMFR